MAADDVRDDGTEARHRPESSAAPELSSEPGPDAMRSSPQDSHQTVELARRLLAEAQPHIAWDSAAHDVRAWYIDRAHRLDTPVPAADRQTDEERCEQCEGSGVVACWNPGGPCPIPNDPACDTCGPCNQCPAARPAHADAVMADLGAAITEYGELREAVARWLARGYGGDEYADDHGSNEHWLEMADELFAVREMRALLDAAAKVQRVEALHRPIGPDAYPALDDSGYCAQDGFIWPCPTTRALRGES